MPPVLEAVDDTTAIILPNPLTLNSVEARRTKAGRLVAGVAAPADIELFKGLGHHSHKPLARRWEGRLALLLLCQRFGYIQY